MPIKLLRKLGKGGFGDVWKAKDGLDRLVAVKLIRSAAETMSSVLDHAKALARAHHPNVVTVHTVEKVTDPETGKRVDAIVMELIAGGTLSKRLRKAPFTREELRTVGTKIIDGLEHIHVQGLAHGDLHEENVMLDGTDVKIIDILYLDSLAVLSTQKKKDRLRRDLTSLRLMLSAMLGHSELDPSEVTAFNNLLQISSSVEDVRAAFLEVTDQQLSHDDQRRLKHAYQRVIDPNFVESNDYALALIAEIPPRLSLPLFKKIVEGRDFSAKHTTFARLLWDQLRPREAQEICKAIGERLDEDIPEGKWSRNLRLLARLGKDAWDMLSARMKIKIEKLITNDVLSGRYDIYGGGTKSGSLGTFAISLWPYFKDLQALLDNIEQMLRSGWYAQNYIGEYFLLLLPKMATTPERRRILIRAIKAAVHNDARIVCRDYEKLPKEWVKPIKKAE